MTTNNPTATGVFNTVMQGSTTSQAQPANFGPSKNEILNQVNDLQSQLQQLTIACHEARLAKSEAIQTYNTQQQNYKKLIFAEVHDTEAIKKADLHMAFFS